MKKKVSIIFLAFVAAGLLGVSAYAVVRTSGRTGLELRWPMNENTGITAFDNSGRGVNGTLHGNASWANEFLSGITSISLDGTNSYVVSDSPVVNLGTSNTPYSMLISVKPADIGSDGNILFVSSGGWCTPFLALVGGHFRASSWSVGAGGFATATNPVAAVSDQWYTLKTTWDPDQGLRLFVNGVLAATAAQGDYAASGVPDTLYVGYSQPGCSGDAGFFHGQVRDFSLTTATTTSGAKIHAADATGLVGWWTMDNHDRRSGMMYDRTANQTHATVFGDTSVVNGKLNQALFFDGDGDYLETSNALGALVGDQITVSVWIKPEGTSFLQGNAAIVSEAYQGDGNVQFALFTNASGFEGNKVHAGFFDGEWHYATEVSSFPFTGEWVHVAATYDGNAIKLYINGALDGVLNYSAPLPDSTENWYIGKRWDYANFIHGGIDDVRIYNRPLSGTEISNLYQAKTTTINASANNRSARGLAGLWSMNGQDIRWNDPILGGIADMTDGTGNTAPAIINSMSPADAPVIGKTGQALHFNAGANVQTGYFVPAQNNSTNLTWSAWVKMDHENSGFEVILGYRNGVNWVKLTPSGFECGIGNAIAEAIPAGSWVHITVVKEGNLFTYYRNGQFVESASQDCFTDGNIFYIGGDPTYPDDGTFSGSIDEVRVYERALSSNEILSLYRMGK